MCTQQTTTVSGVFDEKTYLWQQLRLICAARITKVVAWTTYCARTFDALTHDS